MNLKDLELLKANVGCQVTLHCVTGEVIVAEILSVSDEDQDLIYDLVSSNQLETYCRTGEKAAYLIAFNEVSFVEVTKRDKP